MPEYQPSIVISGTYHRAPEQLLADFGPLQDRCRIISPQSLNFVDAKADFIVTEHQQHLSGPQIEQHHLDAILLCEFVWFHLPEGHLGVSGAYELGWANAHGIPCFARTAPAESQFAACATVVSDPVEAVERFISGEHRGDDSDE